MPRFDRIFRKVIGRAVIEHGTFRDLRRTALSNWLAKGLSEFGVTKRKLSLRERAQKVDSALMSHGTIILITAGGGAFSAMLREAGIQSCIQESVTSGQRNLGMMILLVAFGVSSLVKFIQGSGTVAMITTAPMFATM